jgi:hypothetical protein
MLSRDDQRRLEEIERDLELADPRFVARMRRRHRPRPPLAYRVTFWLLAAMITVPLVTLAGAPGALVSMVLVGVAAAVMFWWTPHRLA